MERSISSLQALAWDLYNAGYHDADPLVYREVAATLYREDLTRRIAEVMAELDRQNALLDAMIARESGRGEARPEAATPDCAAAPADSGGGQLPLGCLDRWNPSFFPQA